MGHATRRTTIVAASALALAGCRWGPEDEGAGGEPEPGPDADEALVERVIATIAAQLLLVLDVGEEHRGLAGVLGPLEVTHGAHLALLAPDDGPLTPTLRPVGLSAAQALASARQGEIALQRRLSEFAQDAVSGDLARALASMSASIAQHVAVLPELGKGRA